MTDRTRHIVYSAIAFIIAVLLAYVLLSFAKEDAQGQIMIVLPPSKWDTKMIELDRKALDEAYINKIKQLFDVWVREGLSSPEGPAKGHAQAQRAYIASQEMLEKREQLLNEQRR